MSSLDPSVIRAWVYVLRLTGDRYYVGVSKELNRRLEEHWSGAGSTKSPSTCTIKVPTRASRIAFTSVRNHCLGRTSRMAGMRHGVKGGLASLDVALGLPDGMYQ